MAVMSSEVRGAPVFRDILYAQSWEDPEVDRKALGIAPDDDVLTIAASGDNAFAFLLDAPRSLTALDFNASQCCLMELKMAALAGLSHGELLEFVGVLPSRQRTATYRRVRGGLGPVARGVWDGRAETIERGVIHAGRFERYLARFRRFVLPWIHSRAVRDDLLGCRTLDEQRSLYVDRWDNRRWRAFFGLFFSRIVMERWGRDPSMFKYVEGDVASTILGRVRHGLTEIPVATNWFLEYLLRGSYTGPRRLPPWLLEDNQPRLQRLLPRLRIVHDEIERFLPASGDGGFSCYALSDIFEYMSEGAAGRLFGALWRASRDGARISYREMMVPRSRPAWLREALVEDEELGARCHRQDRSFFYGAHHVLAVRRSMEVRR